MFIKEKIKYDGAMLHQRFAYGYFANEVSPLGNILAFRGEMEVLAEHMLDLEDLQQQAFIWSDDAINFVWEIPMLGNNAFGAVAFQRLFNTTIADILSNKKYLDLSVTMKGDDIMVYSANQPGKCSVSITHVKDNAALGHTGINIVAGDKAPSFAYSTKLSDQQIENFANDVITAFYRMNQDMFVATSKIITVSREQGTDIS